jgi:hypothetical protein
MSSISGEGNLEITISARGRNIPTQVHPQGSARFIVSFVPLEGTDHIINITFNKELVPGAPFTAKIHTGKVLLVSSHLYTPNKIFSQTLFSDPNHIIVSGHALAATAVGKTSFFTLSNVIGSVEDIEIVIDSPLGDSVPTQVQEISKGTFKAEFCPKVAGEHQVRNSFANFGLRHGFFEDYVREAGKKVKVHIIFTDLRFVWIRSSTRVSLPMQSVQRKCDSGKLPWSFNNFNKKMGFYWWFF